MKKSILSFSLFFFMIPAFSQDYANLNSSYQTINTEKIKNLDFRFESLSFFLNNEWGGDIVDGYTWTGMWIRPRMVYTFSDQLKVEAGAHFLRYHGREDFTITRPWFSANYHLSKQLSVVFGNLNQNNNHGLLKQLWDSERIMTDHPEEGIQFIYHSQFFNFQTWADWRQTILQDDPFQEHFTIGISSEAQLYSNTNLSVSIPLQLLAYHQGGEIDATDLGVVTHYNYASGLKLAMNTGGESVKKINLNFYWLGYQCPDGPEPLLYSNGHALSLVLNADTRWGNFAFDYWNAYQFVSPFGKKLYLSLSDKNWDLSQTDRSIASINYTLDKKIVDDVHFALQAEALMDLNNSVLSYGFGFYLLINHDFFLKKLK